LVPVPQEIVEALGGGALPDMMARAVDLVRAGELAAADATLREYLESSRGTKPRAARAAFIFLLHLLGEQKKHREVAEAFRAPWSPLRDEGQAEFDRTYGEALAATGSHPIPFKRRQRFLELARLLASTRGAAGAVAECGCFRGLSALLLCQTLAAEQPAFDGAGFHVFDSFAGLSEPMAQDAIPESHPNRGPLEHMTQRGAFAATLDEVRRNLARFPGIAYHAGWIPAGFDGLAEQRYRFVHLDVDLYAPTRACLEYFHPRIAAGGAIVSDDYGWPGARRAIDEFCAERALRCAVTASEQAVIRHDRPAPI
jgi:predicted O-methyltransferase YrrM